MIDRHGGVEAAVQPLPGLPGDIMRAQRTLVATVLCGLEQIVGDRSITAAGRALARQALKDVQAIAEGLCPGCDRRGTDIRQQVNGDLVCMRCGRLVA